MSIFVCNYYKYGLLSHVSYKTHYTRMNINLHVTYVYFNGAKSSIEFKFNDYNIFIDMKYILQNLLTYGDNRKIVKLEYYSPWIENKRKTEFRNFKLKMGAYVRATWNTFFHLETKVPIELDTTISRSVKDIIKKLEHPHGYWNVTFYLC